MMNLKRKLGNENKGPPLKLPHLEDRRIYCIYSRGLLLSEIETAVANLVLSHIMRELKSLQFYKPKTFSEKNQRVTNDTAFTVLDLEILPVLYRSSNIQYLDAEQVSGPMSPIAPLAVELLTDRITLMAFSTITTDVPQDGYWFNLGTRYANASWFLRLYTSNNKFVFMEITQVLNQLFQDIVLSEELHEILKKKIWNGINLDAFLAYEKYNLYVNQRPSRSQSIFTDIYKSIIDLKHDVF